MKNKIYTTLVSLFLLSALVLSGCQGSGSKQENLAAGLDLSALGTSLIEEVEFKDTLEPLAEQIWNRHLAQVNPEDVKAKAVYTGGGMIAEEIALFEAKDEASAKNLVTSMKERYEYLRSSYGSYSPDELKNLESPVLLENGVYVLSVISGDKAKAEEVINNWIKENSK